jgi:hypothetical protein
MLYISLLEAARDRPFLDPFEDTEIIHFVSQA